MAVCSARRIAQRPQCGRCRRIGSACSLATQTANLVFVAPRNAMPQNQASNNSSRVNNQSSSISDGYGSNSPSDLMSVAASTPGTEHSDVECDFTDIEKERLKLMNHYALHTSKSITDVIIPQDQNQSFWGEWVTELAFKHNFLLHGLLGLSALHLALKGVSAQRHTVMAIRHHDLGVAMFRPHLSNITPENHDAVFAFSCIVVLYTFGIQRPFEPTEDPIDRLHQVFSLIRGSSILVKADHETMARSRWSVLMLPHPFPPTVLSSELEDVLSKLLSRAAMTPKAARMGVYEPAIQTLRHSLAMAVMYRRTKMTFSYFAVMSPPEFWSMPIMQLLSIGYGKTYGWHIGGKESWMPSVRNCH
ncbi:uncharacterized protein BO96DRAFT_439191 [Aspergillus niger CBS 101883]|uniref:Contig An02c0250, genomic contig n=2 Tax=Aspergillus niger TaxID=5061 RepID=A2QDT0_ASPNC|nr:uncharacterized protein BO96DRAFT_439191 [Aspergillus niger CBS 101883]XP_059600037.1 uncharacterized protein An02g08190 [Aspergillus niger]PYH51245.1 hypothetical protein BO96DRAFT_439191 [Aspergillus niger CBS 101883]CAK37781.1 unnamed protein product [Aspergillus niger]